jgi:hypothetical protein
MGGTGPAGYDATPRPAKPGYQGLPDDQEGYVQQYLAKRPNEQQSWLTATGQSDLTGGMNNPNYGDPSAYLPTTPGPSAQPAPEEPAATPFATPFVQRPLPPSQFLHRPTGPQAWQQAWLDNPPKAAPPGTPPATDNPWELLGLSPQEQQVWRTALGGGRGAR